MALLVRSTEPSVMARYRKSRRSRKGFVAIPFSTSITLSTLGTGVVIANTTVTFGEDLYVISVDAAWSCVEHTLGEGPLQVGLAHGDLSVTEIKEAIEAEVSDPDDIIAAEHARRPVRTVGYLRQAVEPSTIDDGKMIRTKCKFSVGDSKALNVWAANRSGAILTTGAVVHVDGVIYGRWQR